MPKAISHCSLVENMVYPVIWIGPCLSATYGGTPVTTWDGLSLCKVLAMSANPGGICCQMIVLSGCVSAPWVRAATELFAGMVAVGFDHPMPLVIMDAPLTQALQFQLQLCSQELVGSVGSNVLEDVIFT